MDEQTIKTNDRRAQAIVAMNLIKSVDDHFIIAQPGIKSKYRPEFRVSRNPDTKRVVCTCPIYNQKIQEDDTYRCDHIFAVKHFVTKENNQEESIMPRAKQQEETNNDDMGAMSEENFTPNAEQEDAPAGAPGFQSDWFRNLNKPVPRNLIRQREGHYNRATGQKSMLDYVEWHTVVEIFNRVCGYAWSYQVTLPQIVGSTVLCHGTITVVSYDGDTRIETTRDGIGTATIKGDGVIEMAIKKAESDALKRAATKFGVALELYKKEDFADDSDDRAPQQQQQQPQQRQQTYQQPAGVGGASNSFARAGNGQGGNGYNNPRSAPSGSNNNNSGGGAPLASAKQLGLIERLAGNELNNLLEDFSGGNIADLSQMTIKQASEFIGFLQGGN